MTNINKKISNTIYKVAQLWQCSNKVSNLVEAKINCKIEDKVFKSMFRLNEITNSGRKVFQ